MQADAYLLTDELLGAAGLDWYEVSNWARPGHECRHNLLYWSEGDYLGIGCAAHGHTNGRRWWNVRTPERYIAAIDARISAEAGAERLAPVSRAEEACALALRTRFGAPVAREAAGVVEELAAAGFVRQVENRVVLTPQGRLLASDVTARLLLAGGLALGNIECQRGYVHRSSWRQPVRTLRMTELDERKAAILRAIVEHYVDSAQPVGSQTVTQTAGLGVSAATVRNEMSVLERDGFIAQPHTSAGRVPTDSGYRYYVDHLAGAGALAPAERRRIADFFTTANDGVGRSVARDQPAAGSGDRTRGRRGRPPGGVGARAQRAPRARSSPACCSQSS